MLFLGEGQEALYYFNGIALLPSIIVEILYEIDDLFYCESDNLLMLEYDIGTILLH